MISDVMQMAEEGRAEELYHKLRERALESLYFFTKVVLGYAECVDHLHLPFCQHLQESEGRRKRGYLMPRGHFKSTCVSKSYALWRLVRDPEKRVLVIGESDTVGAKNLRDIKWHLTENRLFKWLFPEIIPPDIGATKWTENEVLLPRQKSYDESSITMSGVGAKMTGFHFDLIVYDDIIGEKAAKSEAEMNSAISWFQYAPGLLHDPKSSEEVLIGTRWKHGTADLYGWIMANMPEFEWYVRAAVEDGEVIFPERFNLEILDEIRRREGDYKYSCQYLNNPTPPEGADFRPDWIQQYHVGADGKTIIPNDGSPPLQIGQLLRVSFYDPSAGGKTAKAENAIVGVGEASDRRIFVLAAWSKNCPFGVAIEKWHQLNDQFVFYQNFYELVGAQKAVEDIIRERKAQIACRLCSKSHRTLNPLPVKPSGGKSSVSKEERIRIFAQAAFEGKRVYLRAGMDELRRQILSFPHGDLVDQFDALAYCINKARPPLSDEAVREEGKQEVEWREAGRPRTSTEYDYGGYV